MLAQSAQKSCAGEFRSRSIGSAVPGAAAELDSTAGAFTPAAEAGATPPRCACPNERTICTASAKSAKRDNHGTFCRNHPMIHFDSPYETKVWRKHAGSSDSSIKLRSLNHRADLSREEAADAASRAAAQGVRQQPLDVVCTDTAIEFVEPRLIQVDGYHQKDRVSSIRSF